MPLFCVLYADVTSHVVVIQHNMAAPPQPFYVLILYKKNLYIEAVTGRDDVGGAIT